MSAASSEKMIESVLLAEAKKDKGYRYSTLRSNGFLPHAVLAHEVGESLTQEIARENPELADLFGAYDKAFELALISTRSENGWFVDTVTTLKQTYRAAVGQPVKPDAKAAMAAMGSGGMSGGMGGGGQPKFV